MTHPNEDLLDFEDDDYFPQAAPPTAVEAEQPADQGEPVGIPVSPANSVAQQPPEDEAPAPAVLTSRIAFDGRGGLVTQRNRNSIAPAQLADVDSIIAASVKFCKLPMNTLCASIESRLGCSRASSQHLADGVLACMLATAASAPKFSASAWNAFGVSFVDKALQLRANGSSKCAAEASYLGGPRFSAANPGAQQERRTYWDANIARKIGPAFSQCCLLHGGYTHVTSQCNALSSMMLLYKSNGDLEALVNIAEAFCCSEPTIRQFLAGTSRPRLAVAGGLSRYRATVGRGNMRPDRRLAPSAAAAVPSYIEPYVSQPAPPPRSVQPRAMPPPPPPGRPPVSVANSQPQQSLAMVAEAPGRVGPLSATNKTAILEATSSMEPAHMNPWCSLAREAVAAVKSAQEAAAACAQQTQAMLANMMDKQRRPSGHKRSEFSDSRPAY